MEVTTDDLLIFLRGRGVVESTLQMMADDKVGHPKRRRRTRTKGWINLQGGPTVSRCWAFHRIPAR